MADYSVTKGVWNTLFPSGLWSIWMNSSKYNLISLSKAEHSLAHLNLIKQENFWEIAHHPSHTGLRLGINLLSNQE